MRIAAAQTRVRQEPVTVTVDQLVQRREDLGLSQAKVARLADMNQNSMSKIERGVLPLTALSARRILRALDIYERTMGQMREAMARA